jgi:hypothetical protein
MDNTASALCWLSTSLMVARMASKPSFRYVLCLNMLCSPTKSHWEEVMFSGFAFKRVFCSGQSMRYCSEKWAIWQPTCSIPLKTVPKFHACWSISLNISLKTITKRLYGLLNAFSHAVLVADLLKRSTRECEASKQSSVTWAIQASF